jgi:hypothetical protein
VPKRSPSRAAFRALDPRIGYAVVVSHRVSRRAQPATSGRRSLCRTAAFAEAPSTKVVRTTPSSPPAVPGSVVIHSRDADRRHNDAGGEAEVARREDLAVWLDSDPGFMPVATLLPRPRPPASQSAS